MNTWNIDINSITITFDEKHAEKIRELYPDLRHYSLISTEGIEGENR